MIAFLKKCNS